MGSMATELSKRRPQNAFQLVCAAYHGVSSNDGMFGNPPVLLLQDFYIKTGQRGFIRSFRCRRSDTGNVTP